MAHSKQCCLLLLILLSELLSTKAKAQSRQARMAFDSVKAAREIAIKNEIYTAALAHADSTALSNLYTKDAQILADGDPSTIGRQQVLHFYRGMIKNGISKFTYVTTGVWGSDNNLIVEQGTLTFALSSGKVVAKGRYLMVWKRENGELKIFRDTFFSDPK